MSENVEGTSGSVGPDATGLEGLPALLPRLSFGVNAEETALKAGWRTTEFALLGVVSAALGLATVFNWLPADKAATATGHLTTLLNNIGPLIPIFLLARHFITSRGKLKSNALKAQAAAANPAAALGLFGSSKWGKVLATIKDVAQVTSAVAPGTKVGSVAGKVADASITASGVLMALDRLRPSAAGGKEMVEALRVVVPALAPEQGMAVIQAICHYGPIDPE